MVWTEYATSECDVFDNPLEIRQIILKVTLFLFRLNIWCMNNGHQLQSIVDKMSRARQNDLLVLLKHHNKVAMFLMFFRIINNMFNCVDIFVESCAGKVFLAIWKQYEMSLATEK